MKKRLLPFITLIIAASSLHAKVQDHIPGAIHQYDNHYTSDWFGDFRTQESWLPWIYNETNPGWWLVPEGTNWMYSDAKENARNPKQTITEETIANIEALVEQRIAKYDVPGISISIKVADGEYVNITEGYAEWDLTDPEKPVGKVLMEPDHKFRVGSISKTVTGMIVLDLIEEGKLKLGDTLKEHLNTEQAAILTKYNLDIITIRELLFHYAGVANYVQDTNFVIWSIFDRLGEFEIDTALQYADTMIPAPTTTPGAEFHYANTHFLLLGLVAENVSGKSLQELVDERITKGLDLPSLEFPGPAQTTVTGKHAHGYLSWENYSYTIGSSPEAFASAGLPLPKGDSDVTLVNANAMWGSGSVAMTAEDGAKWMHGIVKGAMLDELHRSFFDTSMLYMKTYPVTPDTVGPALFHIYDPLYSSKLTAIGHRGQIWGYDSTIQYLPDLDTTICIMSNRTLKVTEGANNTLPSNVNLLLFWDIVKIMHQDQFPENMITTKSFESPYSRYVDIYSGK